MFVLGIDPGVTRCGYGAVSGQGSRLVVRAADVITTPPSVPLPERLAHLAARLRDLIDSLSPEVVVVERIFFQVNARTAMSVGQASGLALAAAAAAGCQVAQYSPNEAKQAVTGDGAAGKAQVQAMVARLLGLPAPPRPPDVADALALALCHLARAPLAERLARAGEGRA